MRKGFIFDGNRCVGCKACSVACVLENAWTVRPRSILTFNSDSLSNLPVVNLSLACNHCEDPSCLKGCPSGAYYRDPDSGAVLINEQKCVGCRYCKWNCPYDAPKYVPEKGIVEKCNLCISRLNEGESPACSCGCPTGALAYGEIDDKRQNLFPEWLPDKKLQPALSTRNIAENSPVRIVPGERFASKEQGKKEKRESPEWSLVLFSFFAMISVSVISFPFVTGTFPDIRLFMPLIISAGIASLFHLGKPLRAWRSVKNLSSPLSREIILFIAFALVGSFSVFLRIPPMLIVSTIAGFILLIAIDSVYLFADKRPRVIFHSGQTFLSSLLVISFLSGSTAPFMFIAVIRIVLIVAGMLSKKLPDAHPGLRFLRLAALLIVCTGVIRGNIGRDLFVTIIFLSGELLDRILFYADFQPLNIRSEIQNSIKKQQR